MLGFGASPLGGAFGDCPQEVADAAVSTALSLGIRYFDTSPYYGLGRSEEALGAALARSGRGREGYLLSSKVGRYGVAEFDFSVKACSASLDRTLRRLGTDYLDLVIAHDVEFGDRDQVVGECIPWLVAQREAGRARAVGISGLPLPVLERVVRDSAPGAIDVVLTYCHGNLQDSTVLDSFLPFCRERGIQVINASPLSMGLLTQQGPPSWHPASEEVKAACARAARLCKDRGQDLGLVALRYALSLQGTACTLVGFADPDTVQANWNVAQEQPWGKDHPLVKELREQVLDAVQGKSWPSPPE